jgi:hypothetical protein
MHELEFVVQDSLPSCIVLRKKSRRRTYNIALFQVDWVDFQKISGFFERENKNLSKDFLFKQTLKFIKKEKITQDEILLYDENEDTRKIGLAKNQYIIYEEVPLKIK